MDGHGDIQKNLSANLQRHEDYLHYINVEYPKQLQKQLKIEFNKMKLRDMDADTQAESEKAIDEDTASRRHKQILMAAIIVPVLLALISWWTSTK